MQPAEAAKWLLDLSTGNDFGSAAIAPTATFDAETLQPITIAALLAQLGPPPDAIQRDWDDQLVSLAAAYEQSTGQALPELSSHDILVDPNNRLSFSNALLASLSASERFSHDRIATAGPATVVRPAADENLPDVRRTSLSVAISDERGSPSYGKDIAPSGDRKRKKKKGGTQPNKAERDSLLATHRWLGPTSIFAAAGATLGLTFYFLMPSREPESKSKSEPNTATRSSSIFSPTATSNPKADSAASKSSRASVAAKQAISSVDDMPAAEFQLADNSEVVTQASEATSAMRSPSTTIDQKPADQKPAVSKAMLGLDSFAGGNWVSATDLLPTADFDTNTTVDPTTDPITGKNNASSEMPMSLESSDEAATMGAEQTDEAEQAAPDSPTNRSSGVTSIELPALPSRTLTDEEIEPVTITDNAVNKVELLFPIETALSLVSESGSWVVQDNKDQSPLARIVASDNELQFRWTALAATRPIAKQIASAMLSLSLRDGTTRPLFLRPVVTAEAWPIDLATGDARAAWPISTSVPSGVSRLQVEFQVPETVIQTWVQPHDPEQIRRSQSIVEFTLDSDSKIAIRSRLDLKTGTRVTLRMRHAAQLDPSFPWQLVSTPRIQTALEQVTMQLAQASAEQEQIKVIYYKASSAEKRVLGPQRDLIDSVVLRLRDLSERLTKYDQLLSQLDHAAHMTIRLDVAWPSTAPLANQVIFAMDTPPVSNP